MVKVRKSSHKPLLELDVHQHVRAYLAITWRENQKFKNLLYDSFFIWTHGQEKLKAFLVNLNQFDPYINFILNSNEESIPFSI